MRTLHNQSNVLVNGTLAAVTLHGTYAKLTVTLTSRPNLTLPAVTRPLEYRVDLTSDTLPATLPAIGLTKGKEFRTLVRISPVKD